MGGLIVLNLFGALILGFSLYVASRETQPAKQKDGGPCPAKYTLECVREDDGRFLAEVVPELPGALAYGATAEEAMAKAQAVALRVLAERLEQGEVKARPIHLELRAAVTTLSANAARA